MARRAPLVFGAVVANQAKSLRFPLPGEWSVPTRGEDLNPTPSDKMTRREMLRRTSRSSLVLAAGSALAPFVVSGCSGKKDKGGNTIDVGILHSLTGTMA